jgi:hypothetical protein
MSPQHRSVFVVEHLRDKRRWFDVKRGTNAAEVVLKYQAKFPDGVICAIYRLEPVHPAEKAALVRGARAEGPPT